MLISLYIGLWLTHFISHADLLWDDGGGRFLTILPGIISSIMYGIIVRSTVLLKAVTKLDTDVLEEVLEHGETSKELGLQVKQKMIRRLSSLGEPEQHLRLLFNEIDVDGSQVLSREEFLSFCHAMGITFSKKKWRQIFREIDRDANDEVSYEELFLFLFPDNDAALNQEKRRARQRQRIVEAKHQLYTKAQSSKSWYGGSGAKVAGTTTSKSTHDQESRQRIASQNHMKIIKTSSTERQEQEQEKEQQQKASAIVDELESLGSDDDL
jgi:Ca2+-binding EF-hand superfamily protein